MKNIFFALHAFLLLAPYTAAEPLKIGWIGPLSGNSAAIGEESLKAVQLAVEEYNQATTQDLQGQVTLAVEDDQYQVAKTITAYHKLIGKGVRIFFILNYGALFALEKSAVKDSAIILDPLDCNEKIAALPEGFFCLATRTESIAEAFIADIRTKGLLKVGLLYENSDEWMEYLAERIIERADSYNIQLVVAGVSADTADYRSHLLKLMNERIQALIMIGNDQFGTAVAQLKQMQFFPAIYGIGSFQSPNFLKLSGKIPDGTKISHWDADFSQRREGFMSRYKNKYASLPGLEFVALPSYDLANILIGCLAGKKEGEANDFFRINKCLISTNDHAGVCGKISFDGDGAVRSLNERLKLAGK